MTSLVGARVLIWGFGQIGQTLAPVLAALGAEVRGAARSAGERAGFEVLADDDVLKALPRVGTVRATKVMDRLDIAPNRRLRGLGKHQTAALIAEFGARSSSSTP